MASSMWSAIEGQMTAAAGSLGSSSSATTSMDPNRYLHQQLASALSTFGGDAQYWDESISPSSIRETLQKADPNSTDAAASELLRPMKWLLACISKGRSVADYFALVVKLVGCRSLDVRLLVYMYLVHYADYDVTTRELSLLSINAFQRGLADASERVRAMALRVLTSIRLADILQIQLLAVQRCSRDESPYVRKCAATAVAKLAERCADDDEQLKVLTQMIESLLAKDACCMVLTSAVVGLEELWKHSTSSDTTSNSTRQLAGLHSSFRKLCHLLTDMDEWGQVVVLNALQRYCRTFFQQPSTVGTAERLDRQRRVRRLLPTGGLEQPHSNDGVGGASAKANGESSNPATTASSDLFGDALLAPMPAPTTTTSAAATALPPHPNSNGGPRKIKRKVVKKGFYSDEEDTSTEEEVYEDPVSGQALPVSTAFREPVALNTHSTTFRDAHDASNTHSNCNNQLASWQLSADEDFQLDPDHRLLLHSAMPLLKSRNAGVVLAVCSLLYYCGVASIKIRASMGRALVRIHRDKREIQHVVLASIRTLARECPSAFGPFLADFFIKAVDPPFTRIIKLDILTSLALDPNAIQVVLEELRTHVHDADVEFSCAAIRAVGRVVETARIVHDRQGQQAQRMVQERASANQVALNALFGLLTCSQTNQTKAVVGECVVTMQLILQLLWSDAGDNGDLLNVNDPNGVQMLVVKRILLLLVNTLSKRVKVDAIDNGIDNDGDDNSEPSKLERLCVLLPPQAVASALWITGEVVTMDNDSKVVYFLQSHRPKVRLELARLIARCFPELKPEEKEQGLHFACKLLVSKASGMTSEPAEGPLCEQILAMGRVDVHHDVRDRARFESALMRQSIGLMHDFEGCEESPGLQSALSLADAKLIYLKRKTAPTLLPLDDEKKAALRFGTLSSLVGHRARAYIDLPPWATENSPDSLREPPKISKSDATTNGMVQGGGIKGQFYDASDSDSSSSSSTSDSDDESGAESDSSSGSGSSTTSGKKVTKAVGAGVDVLSMTDASWSQQRHIMPQDQQPDGMGAVPFPKRSHQGPNDSSDSESSSSSSSSSTSSSTSNGGTYRATPVNNSAASTDATIVDLFSSDIPTAAQKNSEIFNGASTVDDFKGLTLAPSQRVGADAVTESDSSEWTLLVRPEHANGVSVESRYLRGEAKHKEALTVGLNDGPSLVCLQIRFHNTKASGVCRNLRILQKSSAGSTSVIAPRRVFSPPEVLELAPNGTKVVVVAIQFTDTSDRDGAWQAKLDFSSSTGTVPLVIKPRLGDMLQPCGRSTVSEFDTAVANLQGFQRVESKLPPTGNQDLSLAADRIMGSLAVAELGSDKEKHRFKGMLPASADPVYILLSKEKLIVCCDHAMAVNSIMNQVKQALQP